MSQAAARPDLPQFEPTNEHVFVGGRLHGMCRPTAELNTLNPFLESYAMTRERATGAITGRRARVWRWLGE